MLAKAEMVFNFVHACCVCTYVLRMYTIHVPTLLAIYAHTRYFVFFLFKVSFTALSSQWRDACLQCSLRFAPSYTHVCIMYYVSMQRCTFVCALLRYFFVLLRLTPKHGKVRNFCFLLLNWTHIWQCQVANRARWQKCVLCAYVLYVYI